MAKELSMTPDMDEIIDGFEAVEKTIVQKLAMFLQNISNVLKKAPVKKNGIFARDQYIDYNAKWSAEGWNFWLSYWQKARGMYTPAHQSTYRLFKDSERKTCMVMLCNNALTCAKLLQPSIYSTHFLVRYRQRHLHTDAIPVEEVAEIIARDEQMTVGVIRTPMPYGTDESKVKIVRRFHHGVCFGYFDYKRQIYYYDTYVADEMLWANQRYMQKDVLGAFLDTTEEKEGSVYVKIEEDNIRPQTDEEIAEYERMKDTPEWKEKCRAETLRMFHENQKRWEKKQRRSEVQVQRQPQHLPKHYAHKYDREYE